MRPFTVVLPVRATKREVEFFEKSLPSAFKINPNEIILGIDNDDNADKIEIKTSWLCTKYGYDFDKIRLIKVKRGEEWNFQLANVVWHCYKEAKYDCILSFDVDSVLRKEVLLGVGQLGKDNVAVVSFTKRTRINSIGELVRYLFYRWRVHNSNYVFSGVYWVYRPYYFANMQLDAFKKIYNGVDTIMTDVILGKRMHRIITRKEKGVNCLDLQNEDLPWRQFQDGIWVFANQQIDLASYNMEHIHKHISEVKQSFEKRKADSYSTAHDTISLMARKARLSITAMRLQFKINLLKFLINKNKSLQNIALKYLKARPFCFVLVKTIMYWHPYFLRGYMWAKKHPDSEAVLNARRMSFNDWGFQGSKCLPKMNWSRKGTGYV